ncbi:MAG TPA: cyclase family protein [Sphingomonadales bacterium]|nr:cyclase family protein [Sphingomonadales bacterium]
MTHATLTSLVSDMASGAIRVVDLTIPLSEDTPVIGLPPEFEQSPAFKLEQISHFDDKGPAWYWNSFSCGEHTGTHFDAPGHWVTGQDYADGCTDTIPPAKLVAPANVIDVSAESAADPDFLLTSDKLKEWEAEHGKIEPGTWVLMRTDWSKRSAEDFLNYAEDGPHTPGPSVECMEFLAHERDILGFGVETVGTDAGQAFAFDPAFPAHQLMHGNNKFGLASLANLDQLPPKGAVVIAAPLKIVHGSGSPLRVIALTA